MLKFCLNIDHVDWTRGDPPAWVDRTIGFARLADEAGLDSLWLNEDPDGWDAFALLGAISRETARIRLGTGVTNPFLRHPNLIASSVATLDRLAPGRAFLGIGRGQPEWYERALGIDGSAPLTRLDEAISLLRQWWEPPYEASIDGVFHVTAWRRSIAPGEVPPIYIAAAGPKALDLAGRASGGVLFNGFASIDYLSWAIARVKSAAESAGRRPDLLAFFANPAVRITENPQPILERKKAFIAIVHTLPGMDRLLMNPDVDVPAVMARVRKLMKTEEILAGGGSFADVRARGDFEAARAAIPTILVEQGSAIGPIDVVREKLRRFSQAGVTHVFLDRSALPGSAEELAELAAALTSD